MLVDSQGPSEDLEIAPVLEALDRLWGATCQGCGRASCGHEIVFSLAMGYKTEPRCVQCLSTALTGDATERSDVMERVLKYVQSKPCYTAAWSRSSEREGFVGQLKPRCLWPEGSNEKQPENVTVVTVAPESADVLFESAEAVFDAGDMSCGDLVLALRIRFMNLAGGTTLFVTATDPAAPVDIPAWCRLTRHRLLRQEHPKYLIERKRES